MMRAFLSVAVLSFLLAVSGCASRYQTSVPAGTLAVTKSQTLNNAASLLFDLLNDEKNVGKVLLIKHDREELHQLIKAISQTAGEAVKELERLAEQDSTLHLDRMNLPPGELAARAAEGKTKTGELLHASGTEFEFKLLLTQVQALGYGVHLAQVAAENSAPRHEREFFSGLSTDLDRLYEQSLALMRAPETR